MQFLRSYKLIFGEPGNDGLVITNLNEDGTYKPDSLRISFDIDKDTTKQTNKSTIKIWNLSDDSIDKVTKNDIVVELWAGYQQQNNLRRIFIGYAVTVETKFESEGKDIVTELKVSDGQIQIRDAIMSVGYPPGTNTKEIINGISTTMGLALFVAEDVEFPDYPDGFSHAGYAKDALDIVCGAIGASWSVQNSVLQIIMSDGTTGMQGFVFHAGSGLIGFPERIVRSAYSTAKKTTSSTTTDASATTTKRKRKTKAKKKKIRKQKKYGWRIKALLCPSLNPADAVRVESDYVTGWFKIEAIKHQGDTRGKDWYSNVDLIEILLDDE